jgi:hypothetical protein
MSFRQKMKRLHTEYEAGDKSALALAIIGCGHLRKPLPPWVAEAWHAGWVNVSMRVADWNDLLGEVDVKTTARQKRERRQLEQFNQLVKLLPTVSAPINRDNGEGFFRELGEKMDIKPRTVREMYYKKLKFNGEEIRLLPRHVLRRRHQTQK